MKATLILITLTILLASVFTQATTKAETAQDFFQGFFGYLNGDFKFNKNCISNTLDSQYEFLSKTVSAKWLDLGDVFRAMSEIEGAVSAVCDFPELKEFNTIYSREVKNGNYMNNLAAKAIYLATIIRDLYDSAYRRDPKHIGVTMGKISDYLVYVTKSLKFLA